MVGSASVRFKIRSVAEVGVAVAVPVAVAILLADVILHHRRAVPADDAFAVFPSHTRLKNNSNCCKVCWL